MTASAEALAILRRYSPNTRVSTVLRREQPDPRKEKCTQLAIEMMEAEIAAIVRADVEREMGR